MQDIFCICIQKTLKVNKFGLIGKKIGGIKEDMELVICSSVASFGNIIEWRHLMLANLYIAMWSCINEYMHAWN